MRKTVVRNGIEMITKVIEFPVPMLDRFEAIKASNQELLGLPKEAGKKYFATWVRELCLSKLVELEAKIDSSK